MTDKSTEEELEDACIRHAQNMGAAEDMWHPDYGWVLRNGEITEEGIEFWRLVFKEME